MDIIYQVIPVLISTASLAVISWVARGLRHLQKDWCTLRDSQRNQLKASIVLSYEKACERGHITPMELDTINRMADSYFDLGGNHYVHAVIKRANEDLEIKGEPIM